MGRFTLAALIAARTSVNAMPYLLTVSGFISTRTAGSAPPPTVTCPMPATCDSFCAMMVDAASYICPCVYVLEVRPRIMIGASAGFTFR